MHSFGDSLICVCICVWILAEGPRGNKSRYYLHTNQPTSGSGECSTWICDLKFNLTQICIIDITMGTYVYNSDLVWYIFLVVLNSHTKPILVKRSWNHLQKLIIQELGLFYKHVKSATSIILLMYRSWGLLVWMSTRCGMQFVWGWYLVTWCVCDFCVEMVLAAGGRA
jgi:hypothetical protein